MTRPTAHLALALALLQASGCAAESAREGDATASPASAAPAARPLGPSTLAYFEPVPDAMGWIRFDPDAPEGDPARREVLAYLPMGAGRAHAAWRADAAKALLWYDPDQGEGSPAPAQLWEVDLVAKTHGALPAPPAGRLDMLGYDAAGRAIALTAPGWDAIPEPKTDKRGRYLTFEGKRYDVEAHMEGQAILVHAFALGADRKWQRVETVVSDTGWDMAQGTRRLAAAAALGARSPELLSSHPETTAPEGPARQALEALVPATRAAAKAQEGEWAVLAPSAGRIAIWQEQGGEFLHATERMAYLQAPEAVVDGLAIPAPAASAKALIQGGEGASGLRAVAPQVRGDRLLVADAYDGEHPRLIDLPTRKVVFSSDLVRGAVFWPAAGAASPAPTSSPAP